MTVPRVSVLMPVFNGGPFLGPAVESILSQTYSDFELLAIDDGSTDGSGDVLDHYARHDARVRVAHQSNQGVVTTLNRGLDLARGEYIARMDADDLSAPLRFETQVAYLDAHPEIAVLGTQMHTINAEGRYLGISRSPAVPLLVRWTMLMCSAIAHPTILARREMLIQFGGYEEAFAHAEDYALWTRMAVHVNLTNHPHALYTYRWWPMNISTQYRTIQMENSARIAQRYTHDLLEMDISLEQARLAVLPVLGKRLLSFSVDEVQDTVEYILHLYEAFTRRFELTATDSALLRRAVGDYLYPLVAVAVAKYPVTGVRLVRQLAYVSRNPRELFRRISSKVRHTLAR